MSGLGPVFGAYSVPVREQQLDGLWTSTMPDFLMYFHWCPEENLQKLLLLLAEHSVNHRPGRGRRSLRRPEKEEILAVEGVISILQTHAHRLHGFLDN